MTLAPLSNRRPATPGGRGTAALALERGGDRENAEVRGDDVLLVVEIADTADGTDGLRYVLETKASIYAEYGVREYRVINAMTLATTVHREPCGKRYASVKEVAPAAPLAAVLVPELSVSLGGHDLQLH